MSIPQYTWNKPRKGRKKDPINLVFTNTSFKQVIEYFNSQGWGFRNKFFDLASDQFIPEESPRNKQDTHRMDGPVWDRNHVRIWIHGKNKLVASAHYETITLSEGHQVHHFEGAEEKIADAFLKSSEWKVKKNHINLNNKMYKKYNNGKATQIKKLRK